MYNKYENVILYATTTIWVALGILCIVFILTCVHAWTDFSIKYCSHRSICIYQSKHQVTVHTVSMFLYLILLLLFFQYLRYVFRSHIIYWRVSVLGGDNFTEPILTGLIIMLHQWLQYQAIYNCYQIISESWQNVCDKKISFVSFSYSPWFELCS